MDKSETSTRNFDLTSYREASKKMTNLNSASYHSLDDMLYDNPERNAREVKQTGEISITGTLTEQRELSRSQFNTNGYYKQIITYYANLLKYSGLLIPNPKPGVSLSTPHISKKYYNAMNYLDSSSLPVWCSHCATRSLVDGCYYGLIVDSKKTLVVLDLPVSFCRSQFKDEDGNDLVEFDVSYFNKIDESDREEALNAYPKQVKAAYRKYAKSRKLDSCWVFLDPLKTVYLPFTDNESPFFLTIIPKTIEYDEAVGIEKQRCEKEIQKIITIQIPHLSDGRLLFEPVEAAAMHEGTVKMMENNKNISVLTSYGDVDSISSNSNNVHSADMLQQIQQNIYSQAGVSGQVFAPTGSAALDQSLNNDLSLMMNYANKIGVILTKIINSYFGNANISFKYTFMPISYYNQDDYINSSFKLVSSGYSFILPALGFGLTQLDLTNVKDLENDLLKLDTKLKPLSTSYTQSGATAPKSSNGKTAIEKQLDEGGRPTLKGEEKTEKTVQNEDSKDKTGGA